MRGNPQTWYPEDAPPQRRRRKPNARLLVAIAAAATVFALGLGSAMGVALMLFLNQSKAPTARTAAAPVVRAAPAPQVAAPSGPTTIAPPAMPQRPPARSPDPVAAMLGDLRYENAAVASAAAPAPLPAEADPGAPPTVIEGIVAAVQRLLGTEPTPEGGIEPVAPAREVVAIARDTDPAPSGASSPDPVGEPLAALDLAEPAPIESRQLEPPPPALPADTAPELAARRAPEPAPSGPIDLTALDLEEEEMDLDLLGPDSFEEADLFVAPTIEDEPAAGLDEPPPPEELTSLDSILVEVLVDEPDVPIRIDGRDAGTVPGVLQVPAGLHTVELYYRGEYFRFTLPAAADPERWCFERKGRGFRRAEC